MGKSDFIEDVRKIVNDLDNRQPLSKSETLQEALDATLSLQRFIAQLLFIFDVIAVTITVSGISGVMAYNINMRTREIGIRMAIGADSKNIIIMILKFGLGLAAIGLACGIICSLFVAMNLSNMLYSVEVVDLFVYGITVISLLVITIVACLLPAYRASAINPISALRTT
jgi:ABC-type antimicrobial peptide transport system permease subunit